jgi:sarcosine oxidase
MSYDVVVAGLGILGACALRELALRSGSVLGVDALTPPHAGGSSHGLTRIIRDAYFEHPFYVPLVRRAREGWRELEEESGLPLFHRTGLLSIGARSGPLIQGSLKSARTHEIPHQLLDRGALRTEWPDLHVGQDQVGVFEDQAGVIAVEAGVQAALDGARRYGAEIRVQTRLLGWEEMEGGLEVRFRSGTDEDEAGGGEGREDRVWTRTLILALGPWLGPLAGEPFNDLQVERQVTLWYDASAALATKRTLPVLLWEPAEGPLAYAIPDLGDGWKVARHHGGETMKPRKHPPGFLPRRVTDEDRRGAQEVVSALLPGCIDGERRAAVCFYTNTPDGHFLVGPHPRASGVLLLGGGSGHAFKFAPLLAARIADFVPGLPAGDRGVGHLWSGDGGANAGSSGHSGTDPFDPCRLCG